MKLREQADAIFAWGMKYREEHFPDSNNFAWHNHSHGAAEFAKKVAEQAGMDAERAYASGLLHDIGRYLGPHTGFYHIVDGYDFLKEKGMPEEIARICMTHSFNPQDSVDNLHLDNPEKEKRIKDYVKSLKYDDYDRLIQLADYMSGSHGISTIERRYCSVMRRHGVLLSQPRDVLNKLYELKEHFNKKIGMDVYELFHDEIAKTPFLGIPGSMAPIDKEIKLKAKEQKGENK
ncbi:HD domain-containing protein [Candidatus Saccharibacteria bacterium]|nr:HD domain-containing protein [Candidatus Saccharibacteria bacterium]